MRGTRDYYLRPRHGLIYDFEYGVAERLGRKLAKYFASSGKRFYVYPVKRRKWESLRTYPATKKLLDSLKYGVLMGLQDVGAIQKPWMHTEDVRVASGLDEIQVVYFLGCPSSVRHSVSELLDEYRYNAFVNREYESPPHRL